MKTESGSNNDIKTFTGYIDKDTFLLLIGAVVRKDAGDYKPRPKVEVSEQRKNELRT